MKRWELAKHVVSDERKCSYDQAEPGNRAVLPTEMAPKLARKHQQRGAGESSEEPCEHGFGPKGEYETEEAASQCAHVVGMVELENQHNAEDGQKVLQRDWSPIKAGEQQEHRVGGHKEGHNPCGAPAMDFFEPME